MSLDTVTTENDDMAYLLNELTLAEAKESDEAPAAAAPVAPAPTSEEALLAELNGITATDAPAAPEPSALDTSAELPDDLLADLETTVAKADAYASQTSDANIADPTSAPEPAKKERKARAPKAPGTGTPRAKRVDLASLPDEVFQLYDHEAPGPANKQVTLGARPTQVKVAEKFDNLFQSIHAGKAPSHYVVTAMKLLNKNGTITSGDLNAAYLAEGLKSGTANSQTGQIMALFSAVGIANRANQALTVRTDSAVGKKLTKIIEAAA